MINFPYRKHEFEQVERKYKENRKRLSNLIVGQSIYEADSFDPNSYFEHKVMSVDVDNAVVHTIENNINRQIMSFVTIDEINAIRNKNKQ